MQTNEKSTKPLKWFVLPNESYKWDFVLDQYVVEDSQQNAASETGGITKLGDESFDEDYIVRHKRQKQRDRFYY